jgi:hypothetical protein
MISPLDVKIQQDADGVFVCIRLDEHDAFEDSSKLTGRLEAEAEVKTLVLSIEPAGVSELSAPCMCQATSIVEGAPRRSLKTEMICDNDRDSTVLPAGQWNRQYGVSDHHLETLPSNVDESGDSRVLLASGMS